MRSVPVKERILSNCFAIFRDRKMYGIISCIQRMLAVKSCNVWFQKIFIPPPPTDGQWKFLGGGGGLKGRNFQGVWGGWAHDKFPGGINAANHTTQTYGKYFDLQCPKTLK